MAPKSANKRTIVNAVEASSRRMPRMRMRGQISESVATVQGNELAATVEVTATNTLGHGFVQLAPGNATGYTTSPIQNVGSQFQFGTYLPGTTIKYIPSCGINTLGSIYIAYTDSPQVMVQYANLTAGQHLSFIKKFANIRTGPLWQELAFPILNKPRRSKFTNDSTLVSNDTNEVDLAVQGMFFYLVTVPTAVTATTPYGHLVLHSKMRFSEVKQI